MPSGKGSKYREFPDLSGRITCMNLVSIATSRLQLEYSIFSFFQEALPMNRQHKLIFCLISSEMDSVSHSFTCVHVKRN